MMKKKKNKMLKIPHLSIKDVQTKAIYLSNTSSTDDYKDKYFLETIKIN